MKIYMSVDMEGITGVFHMDQIVKGCGEYERFRKLMTEDVNAAIQGAKEAGADEILINDAHGSMRNILIEGLLPVSGVRLLSGYPKKELMMEGLDGSFDGAVFIGYHAMAGAEGVCAHTVSGGTFACVEMNGVKVGETALNAAYAGFYGVPLIAESGDNCVEKEALAVNPNIEFAQTKIAHGVNAADCLLPEESRKLIKEKVKNAVNNIGKNKPYVIEGPIELKLTLVRPTLADVASQIPGVTRISGTQVVYNAPDIKSLLNMMATIMNAGCVTTLPIYS